MQTQKTLLIYRQPPYHAKGVKAGIDLAMGYAAFNMSPSLLFMHDGVWQLVPEHQGQAIEVKSVEKALSALPLYDIDDWYVDIPSLIERNLQLEDLQHAPKPLAADAFADFLAGFDQVLMF